MFSSPSLFEKPKTHGFYGLRIFLKMLANVAREAASLKKSQTS
jgi:hypothetical protein